MAIIPQANAVPNPRAMMIEIQHAIVASGAMPKKINKMLIDLLNG